MTLNIFAPTFLRRPEVGGRSSSQTTHGPDHIVSFAQITSGRCAALTLVPFVAHPLLHLCERICIACQCRHVALLRVGLLRPRAVWRSRHTRVTGLPGCIGRRGTLLLRDTTSLPHKRDGDQHSAFWWTKRGTEEGKTDVARHSGHGLLILVLRGSLVLLLLVEVGRVRPFRVSEPRARLQTARHGTRSYGAAICAEETEHPESYSPCDILL